MTRRTDREHGTRAKYVMEKCHCGPCTEANRAYARARDRASRRPDEQLLPAYVDASEARHHLRWLGRQNVGLRAVSARTGIARSTVERIKSGDIRKSRPATIEKILLVFPIDALDHAVIPAGPTWKLLDDLIAHGYTRTFIGRELGSEAKVPSLQVGREHVIASTARKVRALHARLMIAVILDRDQAAGRRRGYREQAA